MSAGLDNLEGRSNLFHALILDQLPQATSGGVPNASYVQSKIEEFSNSFNSSYRLAMLRCDKPEKEQLTYLLLSLKKTIKTALKEIRESRKNHVYKFRCGVCNEQISVNPATDIWTSLQSHEHFEELYYQLVNNSLDISPISNEVQPSSSGSETAEMNIDSAFDQQDIKSHTETRIDEINDEGTSTGDSNGDSGIDQHDIKSYNTGDSNADSGADQHDLEAQQHAQVVLVPAAEVKHAAEDVNKFRFNFQITYDERVGNALYPSSITNCVRKYDKVKDFSIMRISSTRAVCLVCNREMNAMRVSKHSMMGHAMGQKHLKASSFPPVLQLVEAYHDFWLNKDSVIQSHQVYFRPNSLKDMWCSLCDSLLYLKQIVPHIEMHPHKENVMQIYERGINSNFLITLQVQAYGITEEQIEAKETAGNRQEETSKPLKVKKPRKPAADAPRKEIRSEQPVEEILHNIIKSVETSDGPTTVGQLPPRMREYAAQLQAMPNRRIYCELCHIYMPDRIDVLKHHYLSTPAHMAMKKLKYTYYCDICDSRFKTEHAWLNNHNFFGPRHVKMAPSRRNKVAEYECTTCRMVIFGDNLSLSRHKMHTGINKKKNGGFGLPEEVTVLLKSKEKIADEAGALAGDAEEVLKNSLTRDCCSRLESVLSEISPNCKVYPFGSRVSGLGNKDSDLDVFVDIGDTYYGENNQDAKDQVILIRSINKILHKYKEFAGMVPVLTARTPILKLHHVPTRLDCDLSFKHGLSVENTKFLRFCIDMQPICQRLILLVKKWAEYIGFESITTYALAILCIFYLQTNKYLIPVEKLRELNQQQPRVISGWKTIAYVLPMEELKMHIKVYEKTIIELIADFFNYYLLFDFNTYVVCPLLGEVVKRSLFEGSAENLPPEMATYITQLLGDDPELFRSNSLMCIQDPFDLSHNLTKAVKQGTLTRFQGMCKLTYEHLQKLQ